MTREQAKAIPLEELTKMPLVDIIEVLHYLGDTSGNSAYEVAVENGYVGSVEDWLNDLKVNGKSAYDVAVDNGYAGDEISWLISLRGVQGNQGEKGEKGDTGEKGDEGSVDYDKFFQMLVDDPVGIIETLKQETVVLLGINGKIAIKRHNAIGFMSDGRMVGFSNDKKTMEFSFTDNTDSYLIFQKQNTSIKVT